MNCELATSRNNEGSSFSNSASTLAASKSAEAWQPHVKALLGKLENLPSIVGHCFQQRRFPHSKRLLERLAARGNLKISGGTEEAASTLLAAASRLLVRGKLR